MNKNIILPTPYIKLYSTSGEYVGRRTFDETETTIHEDNINPPSPVSDEKNSKESDKDQVVQMEIDGEPVEEDMDDDCQQDDEEDADETNRSETEEDLEDQQVISDEHPVPDESTKGEQGTTERRLRTKVCYSSFQSFQHLQKTSQTRQNPLQTKKVHQKHQFSVKAQGSNGFLQTRPRT